MNTWLTNNVIHEYANRWHKLVINKFYYIHFTWISCIGLLHLQHQIPTRDYWCANLSIETKATRVSRQYRYSDSMDTQ